jgi:hypothetical protein
VGPRWTHPDCLLCLRALTWATRDSRTRGGQNASFTRLGIEEQQASSHSDGQGERPVKPSAQPTQVRTLHLPLPAKTAPGLRLTRPAGRLLVVPPCRIMCCRGVPCRSGYGHIADGSGAEGAVHGTAGSGRRRGREQRLGGHAHRMRVLLMAPAGPPRRPETVRGWPFLRPGPRAARRRGRSGCRWPPRAPTGGMSLRAVNRGAVRAWAARGYTTARKASCRRWVCGLMISADRRARDPGHRD